MGKDEIQAKPYGEFDTVEELLSAYEVLKSQIVEQEEEKGEVAEESKAVYEGDNWQDKITEFFLKFPEAKEFSGEIGKIIMEHPELRNSDQVLEQAYMKLLSTRKTPENLAQDDDFLAEYIYVSPKVKEKIIAEYLSELNSAQPSVITKGGESAITPPRSPKNLNEAMKLAEKLLSR